MFTAHCPYCPFCSYPGYLLTPSGWAGKAPSALAPVCSFSSSHRLHHPKPQLVQGILSRSGRGCSTCWCQRCRPPAQPPLAALRCGYWSMWYLPSLALSPLPPVMGGDTSVCVWQAGLAALLQGKFRKCRAHSFRHRHLDLVDLGHLIAQTSGRSSMRLLPLLP